MNSIGARPSRGGVLHPLGKFTAKFPPFKGPEVTKEILERKATSLHMTLAQYLRELAIVNAHGADTVKSLHIQRIDVVAGTVHKLDKQQQ